MECDKMIHSIFEAFLGRVRDIYRENIDNVTYELYRYNPDNKEMELFCISKDIYLFESMKFIFGQIDTKSLGKYVTLIDEEGSAYILSLLWNYHRLNVKNKLQKNPCRNVGVFIYLVM